MSAAGDLRRIERKRDDLLILDVNVNGVPRQQQQQRRSHRRRRMFPALTPDSFHHLGSPPLDTTDPFVLALSTAAVAGPGRRRIERRKAAASDFQLSWTSIRPTSKFPIPVRYCLMLTRTGACDGYCDTCNTSSPVYISRTLQ